MNKENQIKNINIPDYRAVSLLLSFAIGGLLSMSIAPVFSPDKALSPSDIGVYAIVYIVVASFLLGLSLILEEKLTKTTIKTKNEKIIKFEDNSFVTTDKLSNRRNVGFVIKNGDHQIVGNVLPSDIKVSEEGFSYVKEITTEQTSTIFNLSNKTENKKYLLYLSPATFNSVKSTFID